MISSSKRKKPSASYVPRGGPRALPRDHPHKGDKTFHPMGDPLILTHLCPHVDDMEVSGRSGSDTDDDCVDPDECLHNTLSYLGPFSLRLRMPPLPGMPAAGANGVSYDGPLLHEGLKSQTTNR